jgi:glycosyltransferase involved in cell wall biosynthesis
VKTEPLVSIITPTLNSGQYLEDTILSIIKQTYKNIEYIIVDGCSSDDTYKIIEKYKKSISQVIIEKDTGMYAAVNRGIANSSGEIIAYLNSDDLYHENTIEIIVDIFLKRSDVDLIYGSEDVINNKGEYLYNFKFPKYIWPLFVSANFSTIGQPCSFWRKSVHKISGYFDEDLKMAADFDFFCKVGKELSVLKVNKTLGSYRLHEKSLTSNNHYLSLNDINKIHSRYVTGVFFRNLRPLFGIIQQFLFRTLNIKTLLIKYKLNASKN